MKQISRLKGSWFLNLGTKFHTSSNVVLYFVRNKYSLLRLVLFPLKEGITNLGKELNLFFKLLRTSLLGCRISVQEGLHTIPSTIDGKKCSLKTLNCIVACCFSGLSLGGVPQKPL